MLVSITPPQLEIIESAWVTPYVAAENHRFSGEVFRCDGSVCTFSLRRTARTMLHHEPLQPARSTARPKLKGHYLYGGHIFGIFGHDLFEFPGRLWPLLSEHRFDGIVCQSWKANAFNRTIAAVLPAFGIEQDDVVVVSDEVEVESLTVPEQAIKINDHCLSILGDCYRRLAMFYRRPVDTHKGFYLSRRMLGGLARSVRSEATFEREAIEAGLTVIHPQTLPLPDQIGLMAGARNIVGPDGSAMHLAAFAKPGTLVLSFETRHIRNQRIINEVMGLEGRYVDVNDRELSALEVTDHLASALDR